MSSFNKVILMGNLTADPELKYLPSNTAVCELRLATNHRWRDKDGNQREEVCYVDVSVFGRGAEIVHQYMTKGRTILVEGRLKYDTWTAQDGTKRSKHSIVADNFTFVGGPRDGGGGAPARAAGEGARGGEYAAPESAPRSAPRGTDRPAQMEDAPPARAPEDIPF